MRSQGKCLPPQSRCARRRYYLMKSRQWLQPPEGRESIEGGRDEQATSASTPAPDGTQMLVLLALSASAGVWLAHARAHGPLMALVLG